MHRDPGLVEAEQHPLRLDAGDAEAHDVGEAVRGVTEERHVVQRGHMLDDALA